MELLRTEGLRKIYGAGESAVRALDGVDISIGAGEFTAVVGTSGSGKSTLLHLLGGLDRPTAGRVFVAGRELYALDDDALTIFRRRNIGFVFQSFNLIPILNVYENVTLPIGLDGAEVDTDYVESVIDALGLTDKRDFLPDSLSGGQRQRVAIARALAAKPAIILADEPTGNLDSKTSAEVLTLLRLLNERFSQTMVMITHNEIIELFGNFSFRTTSAENSKTRSVLRDLFGNQPGCRTSPIAQIADRIIRVEDGKVVTSREALYE